MSDFDPADVPAGTPTEISDRFGDTELPGREGLPARYRMRADSHYVEQLLGGAAAEGDASTPPPAAPRSGPAFKDAQVRPPQERQERLLVEIARDLSEIETATDLLEGSTSALTRRIGLDLIQARTWQALWLLRANAVLAGTHRGRVRRQSLDGVLLAVARGLAAECRLFGVRLDLESPDGTEEIEIDGEALVAGIAGATLWTLNLMGEAEGAVVRLVGRIEPDGTVKIEVVQPDPELAGDGRAPAGSSESWTAELGASVAKAVAALHEGEAAFLVADGRRSVVRLTFSRSRP